MRFFFIIFILISYTAHGQEKISNKSYFKHFFKEDKNKNLLIIGENHSSAVGSDIYPTIIKYLHRKTDMNTLLIEFGPAEAYFYSKYLKTGNEKHLNYTLYAGGYQGWREAWREIYKYNKSLKKPLKIIGIDFDRTRTLAYALVSMLQSYDDRPAFIDTLLNEIRTDKFYKTYTVGYPTKKDIEWATNTKKFLDSNRTTLQLFLKADDMEVVDEILKNKAVNYAEGREEALTANTQRIIEDSKENEFLLLIGRNHAYINPIHDNKKMLAKLLIENSSIKVKTGVILFENSVLQASKDKQVTLFETQEKIPWKRYYSIFEKKSKRDLTIIPFTKELCPLAHYTDYILLARNKKPYEFLNQQK